MIGAGATVGAKLAVDMILKFHAKHGRAIGDRLALEMNGAFRILLAEVRKHLVDPVHSKRAPERLDDRRNQFLLPHVVLKLRISRKDDAEFRKKDDKLVGIAVPNVQKKLWSDMVGLVRNPLVQESGELFHRVRALGLSLGSGYDFLQILHISPHGDAAGVPDLPSVRINAERAKLHLAFFEDGAIFGEKLRHGSA